MKIIYLTLNPWKSIATALDKHDNGLQVRYQGRREEIKLTLETNKIKKLFYWDSNKFNLNGDNWGNSKGMTFKHVCMELNDTSFKKYIKNELSELAPQTLCKLYVACTRSSGDLFFIKEKDIPVDYKIKNYINLIA